MITTDFYSILIFLCAAIVGSLVIVLFAGSKKLSSRLFAFTLVPNVLWMTGVGVLKSLTAEGPAEFFTRFDYFMGGVIAAVFLYFCLTFPEDRKPKWWIAASLILTELIFIPLYYKGFIIYDAFWIGGIQRWSWHFGPLWFLFDLFFNGFFILGLAILYMKYRRREAGQDKTNLKFMFWSMVVALIPTSTVNIVLPRMGYQSLNWFGPISSLAWVSIFTYSIVRYRQMNVKAVAAEVFILVMSIVLFADVFVTEATLGVTGRIAVFISFTIIGYFFIRGILREAEQREQLEVFNNQLKDLNENLQEKVDEQTQEIRRAYEVEKKARVELQELDKAKDQFILTTQHHLRTPLTIIKGYLQSFISEKSSSLDSEGKSYLEKASSATDRVSGLVNELLDISEMQVGKSILKKEAVNLRALVEGILDDLSVDITKRRLSTSLTFPPKEEDNFISLDKEKMKEALTNLIDNAVKYNREGGEIKVKGERTHHPIERDKLIYRLSIEDTGIGIPEEELPKLFTQYFERGKEAEKVYTTGRGIGLAITKNIIQAHQGRIYADSLGRGTGSKFIVELPV